MSLQLCTATSTLSAAGSCHIRRHTPSPRYKNILHNHINTHSKTYWSSTVLREPTTSNGLYMLSFSLYVCLLCLSPSLYLCLVAFSFCLSLSVLSLASATDVSSGRSCPCPDTSSFLSGRRRCFLYWCFVPATVAVPLGLQLSSALCDCLAEGTQGSL